MNSKKNELSRKGPLDDSMAGTGAAIKVLAFDIFGTVVDWHGSIAREVDAMKLGVDGGEFALAWRAGYQPAMRRVMSGELGWTLIDDQFAPQARLR